MAVVRASDVAQASRACDAVHVHCEFVHPIRAVHNLAYYDLSAAFVSLCSKKKNEFLAQAILAQAILAQGSVPLEV